ncbi:MAG: hypothetical protein F4018_19930 [Acidobacteria bacterium]|nr:hypothetical protein [Acidobacteriota bacterium]MYK90427.1 hypothetical protein [Acidobacteriota bacterium]
MRLVHFSFTVALGMGLVVPAVAGAQEPDAPSAVETVDASRLPVSLERIKRRMAAAEPTREGRRGLLDLNFYIDVYARAPAIELLRDFDLDSENVSYGSPTHREMLEAATPREWRPRAISTGNLFGWR